MKYQYIYIAIIVNTSPTILSHTDAHIQVNSTVWCCTALQAVPLGFYGMNKKHRRKLNAKKRNPLL